MRVVVLRGDGVGPEIVREAERALHEVLPDLVLEERPFGADAIRQVGDPLPAETLEACRAADAILKGPIGDPEFDAADVRPEQGLLRLRAALDVYANLRPARQGPVPYLRSSISAADSPRCTLDLANGSCWSAARIKPNSAGDTEYGACGASVWRSTSDAGAR